MGNTARLEQMLASAHQTLRRAATEADRVNLEGAAHDLDAMRDHLMVMMSELLDGRRPKSKLVSVDAQMRLGMPVRIRERSTTGETVDASTSESREGHPHSA